MLRASLTPGKSGSGLFFKNLQSINDTALMGVEKQLLLLLAIHQGKNEWTWISVDRLAGEMTLTARRVRQLLRQLVELGVVLKRRRSGQSSLHAVDWNAVRQLRRPEDPDGNAIMKGAPPHPQGKPGSSITPKEQSSELRRGISEEVVFGSNSQRSGVQAVSETVHAPIPWMHPTEFRSLAQGQQRFQELCRLQVLHEQDELSFLSGWHRLMRRPRKVRKPGAVIAAGCRKRKWPASNADEIAAQEFLREQRRARCGQPSSGGVPEHIGDVTATLLASI